MTLAVDANVLVRFLVRDDPAAFEVTRHVFEQSTIVIPMTVLVETEWVLRFRYGFRRDQIADALERLFSVPTIEAADPRAAYAALGWFRAGMDLADAVHLAVSAGCDSFVKFDRNFVRLSTRMQTFPPAVLPQPAPGTA